MPERPSEPRPAVSPIAASTGSTFTRVSLVWTLVVLIGAIGGFCFVVSRDGGPFDTRALQRDAHRLCDPIVAGARFDAAEFERVARTLRFRLRASVADAGTYDSVAAAERGEGMCTAWCAVYLRGDVVVER